LRIEFETSRAGWRDKNHTRPSGEATQRICREAHTSGRITFQGEDQVWLNQRYQQPSSFRATTMRRSRMRGVGDSEFADN
jgi:hypothetical protein